MLLIFTNFIIFDCIVFLSWSQIEVPSTLGWLPTTFCFSSLFSPRSLYYSFLSKRNLTALYLPLVSHWLTDCHFKIWTQRNDFGDLRPFRLLIRVMSGQKKKLLRCFLFLALKMKQKISSVTHSALNVLRYKARSLEPKHCHLFLPPFV